MSTSIFDTPIQQIDLDAIRNFLRLDQPVNERPSEDERIEFKEDLEVDFEEAAAALANTSGGVILIGVKTKREKHGEAGIPDQLLACESKGPDPKVHIYNRLLANIYPSIDPTPEVLAIRVTASSPPGYVILIRVPESRSGPHEYLKHGSKKLSRRYGNRNAQMGIREIEDMIQRRNQRKAHTIDIRKVAEKYTAESFTRGAVDLKGPSSVSAVHDIIVGPTLPLDTVHLFTQETDTRLMKLILYFDKGPLHRSYPARPIRTAYDLEMWPDIEEIAEELSVWIRFHRDGWLGYESVIHGNPTGPKPDSSIDLAEIARDLWNALLSAWGLLRALGHRRDLFIMARLKQYKLLNLTVNDSKRNADILLGGSPHSESSKTYRAQRDETRFETVRPLEVVNDPIQLVTEYLIHVLRDVFGLSTRGDIVRNLVTELAKVWIVHPDLLK